MKSKAERDLEKLIQECIEEAWKEGEVAKRLDGDAHQDHIHARNEALIKARMAVDLLADLTKLDD
jgi:hypothetical protein